MTLIDHPSALVQRVCLNFVPQRGRRFRCPAAVANFAAPYYGDRRAGASKRIIGRIRRLPWAPRSTKLLRLLPIHHTSTARLIENSQAVNFRTYRKTGPSGDQEQQAGHPAASNPRYAGRNFQNSRMAGMHVVTVAQCTRAISADPNAEWRRARCTSPNPSGPFHFSPSATAHLRAGASLHSDASAPPASISGQDVQRHSELPPSTACSGRALASSTAAIPVRPSDLGGDIRPRQDPVSN